MQTHVSGNQAAGRRHLQGLAHAVAREAVATRGGAPVLHEGRCATAVSVSTAQPEIDGAIGDYALKVLNAALRRVDGSVARIGRNLVAIL